MLARLSRFDGFDHTFDLLDELRRQMGSVWDERPASTGWPRVDVFDAGANLVVSADVPGLADKDIKITLHDGVLAISGERKGDAPEGYLVHRQERGAFHFSRSFRLPAKVDPERTVAEVKNGVLTITIAKAAEAQPRQISVRAER